MSSFELNRFGQALKCYFLVSRKTWIRIFGIYTMVMFFAGLFFTRIANASYSYLIEHYPGDMLFKEYGHVVKDSASFGIIFFCFSMLFGASYLFAQMKDTRKRSAYLLWPVSNSEKYVVGLLHSIVLMAVLAVLSFIMADALRVLVDVTTGRIIVWGIPLYYNQAMSAFSVIEWQVNAVLLFGLFYFHSLYIVGGTLFRRYQFLSTSAIIAIVIILFVMFVNQTGLNHVDFHFVDYVPVNQPADGSPYQTFRPVYNPSFYVALLAGWLIIAFHYWASFKLFCRMQVINNKWLNV
jgi:hypothetical protein